MIRAQERATATFRKIRGEVTRLDTSVGKFGNRYRDVDRLERSWRRLAQTQRKAATGGGVGVGDVLSAGGMGGPGGLVGMGTKGGIIFAAAAATAALGHEVVKTGFEYNKMLESAEVGYTTLLGSTDKAKARLADIEDFAVKTPFKTSDLIEADRYLQAIGYDAKDVLPLLTAIGDANSAQGGNPQGLENITRAFAQMKTYGVVHTEELNQLASAGIPAFEILAEKMGKTNEQLRKMIENGKLASDVAIPLLEEGMDERFHGAMAAQAQTVAGLESTLSDQKEQAEGRATKGAYEVYRRGLKRVTTGEPQPYAPTGNDPFDLRPQSDYLSQQKAMAAKGAAPVEGYRDRLGGDLYSGSIAGHRAGGGPVSAGKTYLVGEQGPELFTSRSGGSITANDQMGGGIKPVVSRMMTEAEQAADALRPLFDGIARGLAKTMEGGAKPLFDFLTQARRRSLRSVAINFAADDEDKASKEVFPWIAKTVDPLKRALEVDLRWSAAVKAPVKAVVENTEMARIIKLNVPFGATTAQGVKSLILNPSLNRTVVLAPRVAGTTDPDLKGLITTASVARGIALALKVEKTTNAQLKGLVETAEVARIVRLSPYVNKDSNAYVAALLKGAEVGRSVRLSPSVNKDANIYLAALIKGAEVGRTVRLTPAVNAKSNAKLTSLMSNGEVGRSIRLSPVVNAKSNVQLTGLMSNAEVGRTITLSAAVDASENANAQLSDLMSNDEVARAITLAASLSNAEDSPVRKLIMLAGLDRKISAAVSIAGTSDTNVKKLIVDGSVTSGIDLTFSSGSILWPWVSSDTSPLARLVSLGFQTATEGGGDAKLKNWLVLNHALTKNLAVDFNTGYTGSLSTDAAKWVAESATLKREMGVELAGKGDTYDKIGGWLVDGAELSRSVAAEFTAAKDAAGNTKVKDDVWDWIAQGDALARGIDVSVTGTGTERDIDLVFKSGHTLWDWVDKGKAIARTIQMQFEGADANQANVLGILNAAPTAKQSRLIGLTLNSDSTGTDPIFNLLKGGVDAPTIDALLKFGPHLDEPENDVVWDWLMGTTLNPLDGDVKIGFSPGEGIAVDYFNWLTVGGSLTRTLNIQTEDGQALPKDEPAALTSRQMAAASGGGGTTVNNYITVEGSVLSENELLELVVNGLRRRNQQNGSVLG